MKNDYFDYPLPFSRELREIYDTPYRFSDELTEYIDYLFKHPYNKNNKIYANTRKDWDPNDMAKALYLRVKYYLDHPQQFGHAMDNIAPQCLVAMWKRFIAINKNARKTHFKKYYPTDMKLLKLVKGRLFDLILEEIATKKFYMTGEDMMKRREGMGLREKRVTQAGRTQSPHVEYLCSLE